MSIFDIWFKKLLREDEEKGKIKKILQNLSDNNFLVQKIKNDLPEKLI